MLADRRTFLECLTATAVVAIPGLASTEGAPALYGFNRHFGKRHQEYAHMFQLHFCKRRGARECLLGDRELEQRGELTPEPGQGR